MINFRSTPKNPAILARDGKLLLAAKTGILLAVSYSIFTEFNFIHSSIGSKISIPYIGGIVKTLITLFCIFIIEGGGLVALAYIIDRVLKNEWKQNKINLIGSFLMLLICYSFTVTTSIGGTQKISSKIVEAPTMVITSNVDSTAQQAQKVIKTQYSNDSLLIAQSYNLQIRAITNEYNAKAAKLQTSIDNYKRKGERTGKSYISSINYLKGKIQGIKSDQAAKVGTIEISKSNELKTLLTERKADAKTKEQQYKKEKNIIVSSNANNEKKYKAEKENVYSSMWYGIFLSLPLLAASMLVYRNILHKSGIEESTQFDDYFYRESIFEKMKNYVRVVFLEKIHSFFDEKLKAFTKKEYELSMNEVYERTNNTKVINLLEVDAAQINMDVITARYGVENGNDGTVGKGTIHATNSTPTDNVGNGNGEETTTVKCKKTGCSKRFDPYPKTKKFCSKKCRMSHHKFELKK
jgi:hypothetical protein